MNLPLSAFRAQYYVRVASKNSKRLISTETARKVLGIPKGQSFTAKELRDSYFLAAKSCHPDVAADGNAHTAAEVLTKRFQLVTEAYEFLQGKTTGPSHDLGITESEEEEFRRACQDLLGVSAEVVEESKKCPMFRTWLQGKTDAAYTWKSFFARYGGLAPKLRPRLGLPEGEATKKKQTRRKKFANRRES